MIFKQETIDMTYDEIILTNGKEFDKFPKTPRPLIRDIWIVFSHTKIGENPKI